MILFENFNKIESICQQYGIKYYTINPDGSVDVNGNVNLSECELTKLPLNFRNVSGNFYCNNNQLTTLEGAPKSVGVGFYCDHNQLTTLKGLYHVRNIYYDNNPISKILDNITGLQKNLDKVIEVFNDYDNLLDMDPDYLKQLLLDYGIKYKI